MSYANILLMDPEIRGLLKKAKDLFKDSPSKQEFATLVLAESLRPTAKSEVSDAVLKELKTKSRVDLTASETLQILDSETGSDAQREIAKAQQVLTGRLVEELKQQNPEVFEEQLMKQAETETEQLRKDMQQLAQRSSFIMKDFTDKFIGHCRTDLQEGLEKLSSDENLDTLVLEELATYPDDVSKAILENIFEVKKPNGN